MLRIPRFVATTSQEQIKELRAAIITLTNEANAKIQSLERKINTKEDNNNGV